MGFIKNIEHEAIFQQGEQVNILPGQVVSKTLVQNKAISFTLFALAKGEEISTHDSDGDALVTIIEGTGEFTVDGIQHLCNAGESLVMPAKKPHSVYATENFKMSLLVIFPTRGEQK